jgi:hypothetical protein
VISGENIRAETNVFYIEDGILVQENKRHLDELDHFEPQFIVPAALSTNNRTRQLTLRLPHPPSKLIPGITMTGTASICYQTVTRGLVTHVAGAAYPQTETIVYAHIPIIPRSTLRCLTGMHPFRRIILSCYMAFHDLWAKVRRPTF